MVTVLQKKFLIQWNVNLLDCLSPFEDLVIQMAFLCLCISMRVGSAFLHRLSVGDLTHDKTQFTLQCKLMIVQPCTTIMQIAFLC